MNCPVCERENREGAAFCDGCGSPLIQTCPACNSEVRPGARFCDTCGNQLAAAPAELRTQTPVHLAQKILRERGEMEGERRTVTVMFVDAKGFTPLSEQLDAEQVYSFMHGATDRMLASVHRYEGTVTQFTGDGIMATFGAPIAHEDSARRAVAAALDMQGALNTYVEEAGVKTAFRIGLNTGPVIVGRIGDDLTMEYTAIGDTTNLAARMEQMCEPGAVFITEQTYRDVVDYFDFEDLGRLDVKGKAEPVHAYKAVSERPIRSRLDAAVARGLSPFVGRDRDIDVLTGLWNEALAGRGQIVMISGEPGIGKSRLLLEFHRALGPDVIWREAHCVTYGENIPYLPVIELVRHGFGINEADDAETIIRKVDDDVVHWSPDAQKVVPYLKFLLQVDPGDTAIELMDPMERRAGILDALRALVLERARVAPRVVVVEDLHWADDQSEEAFRVVADAVEASPVLMILTFRPGYLHPSAQLPNANRIVLGNLDADARAELATSSLSSASLPTTLAAEVTKKAEGNPLFIEEVTKALAGGAADANAVPNSLQDVILARIDRLERSAREALQLASVIGREFTLRLLDRISDLQSELEGVLGELKGLELIYEKAFFPELAYMFKHALTHDVAYSTLLVERRKALHGIVAAAIEELYDDRIVEHYETLAYHFAEAEKWPKALDYIERTVEKASDAFANREAFDFAGRGIEICRRLGDPESLARMAHLAETRAYRAFALGELSEARTSFLLMAETAENLGDAPNRAFGIAAASMIVLYEHDLEGAEEFAKNALAIEGGDANSEALAKCTYMCTAMFTDRFDLGRQLTNEIEALCPSLTHEWTIVMVAGLFLPLVHEWSGRYTRGLQAVAEAKEKYGETTDILLHLFGKWMEGITQVCFGNHQSALDGLLHDVPFAGKIGEVLMYLRGLNTIGFVYGDLHDFEHALEWNRRGLEEALAAGLPDPEVECNAALNVGDNLKAMGRLDEAEEQYAWVEKIYRNPTAAQRFMLWRYSQHMLHSYGELKLLRGDDAAALSFADECLDLAQRSDSPKNVVKARRLRGQVFMARGKLDDAATELEGAIAVAREIGNAGQLWRTLAVLGELRTQQSQKDAAEAARAEALEIIDRIAAGLTDEPLRNTFLSSAPVEVIRVGAS